MPGNVVPVRKLKLDDRGLITAVAQDRLTGQVRMVAWMNLEALERTRETGFATFFSRSRQQLWTKWETSGHRLRVAAITVDCDGDTLLITVEPAGPACHTGAVSCFFEPVRASANDQSTNGPIDQRTNRPTDQSTNGPTD